MAMRPDPTLPVPWPPDHPVLGRLRALLVGRYGDRLKRAVLFGSRARGDARDDSDWDVAAFLDPPPDDGADSDLSAALARELGAEAVILLYPVEDYAAPTPLMDDIREEGIDLLPDRMPSDARSAWERRRLRWKGPMKEISAVELEAARKALARAEQLGTLGPSLASVAAREAYGAAFHAALALVHERLGRTTKTHNGVQALFSRLAAAPDGIGREHAAFLSKAYAAKQIHDYDARRNIDPATVPDMLRNARALVEAVAGALEKSAE